MLNLQNTLLLIKIALKQKENILMQIKNKESCVRSITDEHLVRAVRHGLQPLFHPFLAGKEDLQVQLFAMMFSCNLLP